MKRHFITLWMAVRLSATTPASMNGCSSPWWDASRRGLNLVEDILSTYYKCTLSAIIHKLKVPRHMLIWTFSLVLICGTRAQNLPAPFIYSLYILAIEEFSISNEHGTKAVVYHNGFWQLQNKIIFWTVKRKVMKMIHNWVLCSTVARLSEKCLSENLSSQLSSSLCSQNASLAYTDTSFSTYQAVQTFWLYPWFPKISRF
jgi:hypothetical protein